MNRTIAVLLLGLVVGSSRGQDPFGQDWMRGLFESINQLNANIQENVQQLNQRIQDDVRGHLAQIDRLNSDVSQSIGKARGQTTTLGGNTGSTILINGGVGGGSSRIVFSSQGTKGEPYFRDIEERVVDGILHHTERVYNSSTRSMDEYRYTLDLKNPNAKPVPV